MRKWAYLTEPRSYNGQTIYKVMIYEKEYESLVVKLINIEENILSALPKIKNIITKVWELIL